jgi:hypothetical protein
MPVGHVSDEDYRVGQLPHLGMHADQPVDAQSVRPVARASRSRTLRTVVGWAVSGTVAATLLTGCGGGSSSATRLTKVSDAQVVTAAGQTVAARPGLTLRVGDQVRTGPDGAAVIATGERRAYLGGQGMYTVRGRSSGVLGRGAFVVDGRHGPALTVTSGPVTARIGRSAVRVEHGFAVRVGVLAGRPVTVSADPAGGPQQLSVPSLFQVVVAGRGLAGTSPLTLTDDDAERLVVPDLVGDDVQLNRTAVALDAGSEGRAIVRIASADFGATASPRRPISETALPMAMARAVVGSSTNQTALQQRYGRATTLRNDGGSWAVVARLIGTDATATSSAIDALLVGVPSAGTVLAAAPGGPGSRTVTGGGTQARSSGSNNSSNGGGNGSGHSPSGGNPGSHPSPSPSPSPGPLQQVVDGVLGVLPPVTAPTSSPKSCKVLNLVNC